MSFQCKKCDKIFKYDYLLTRHNTRKTPCVKDNNEEAIQILNKKINEIYNESLESTKTCNFCKKEFKCKRNLIRHMDNYCEHKRKMDDKKNMLVLEDINKEHNKHYQSNPKIINNNINNNNNNNINNNINIINNINNINNIQLNAFGNEDLSHITLSEYKKILSTFFPGFVEYIKTIYFDDRMPTNHNVYISKINSKYAYIYEDNHWYLKRKSDIVDKILTRKRLLLNDKCNELYDNNMIDENIFDLHGEFNRNYYDGGKDSEKLLSDDIELLLFNYNKKILEKK